MIFWFIRLCSVHCQAKPIVFFPGDAEEATTVFSETASLCVQKNYSPHGASQGLPAISEDKSAVSARTFSSQDFSPRQLKSMHVNNLKDNTGNYHATALSGGAANQPINGGLANMSFYSTPSPMAAQVDYLTNLISIDILMPITLGMLLFFLFLTLYYYCYD